MKRRPAKPTLIRVRSGFLHHTRFLTALVVFGLHASFGREYNEGPWARDTVHQIKGGKSQRRTGNLKATAAQLRYLRILGYDGDLDLTRYQASDIIEHLKRKRQT